MKVTIEMDLSPAEAREIFGLPDFSQFHQQITADIIKKYQQNPTAAFEEFVKPTMESGFDSFAAYQKMMTTLMTSSK